MYRPSVSICLPVYNGEQYLEDALESALAQTFDDFELIISDNASTDRTAAICRAAVARDHRVRYTRAGENRGLAWNFNHAFRQARGRYLVWMGHDDRLAPDFVARSVEALERHADAVLCFSNANYIDADGALVRKVELENPGAPETPAERFRETLWDTRCDPICGMMRVSALNHTRLHGRYADSDRVLLAEMGLQGRFLHIPDFLFSRRWHANQATTRYRDRWDRSVAVFDPRLAGKLACPWLRETMDLLIAVRRASLSWRERMTCGKYLQWWVLAHKTFFRQDFVRGLRVLVGPPGFTAVRD